MIQDFQFYLVLQLLQLDAMLTLFPETIKLSEIELLNKQLS